MSNVAFQYADADELQFDSDSFDLVVCSLGIMYCNPDLALREFVRVAKRGIMYGIFRFVILKEQGRDDIDFA